MGDPPGFNSQICKRARKFIIKGGRDFRAYRRLGNFYGLFYGQLKFCCKTARMCANPCEWLLIEIPSVRDGMQNCGNVRNNSLVDLEIRCSLQLSYGRIYK